MRLCRCDCPASPGSASSREAATGRAWRSEPGSAVCVSTGGESPMTFTCIYKQNRPRFQAVQKQASL